MPMSRAERAQRLAQLREQLNAITAEISRLEREDDGYVAYAQRAQASRQNVLPYGEFAKYAVAFEQLEALWAQAGRPQNWERLPLLMQLRRVLLVPAPAAAPVGTRPAASGGGAAVTAPPRPEGGTPTNGPAAPATQGARPAAPAPGTTAPAPAAQGAPAAPAAKAAEPAEAPKPAAQTAAGRAQSEQHANLAEQHSPILNEVVELLKRAEEEFKSSQLPAGLASVDRAVYLLERVFHAPPAQVARVVKLLDDTRAGATQIAESDRQRWESVRERAAALAEVAA